MRLSDSDDDAPAADGGEPTPAVNGGEPTPGEGEGLPPDPPESDPQAFVEHVAAIIDDDPDAAADAVGDLLRIARETEGATRVAAGEALDAIGRRQPSSFEVWSSAVASAARSGDEEVAFFGMRALAQLAGTTPRAAAKGLDAALSNLRAPSADLRRAAISVLAEVGPSDPDAVKRADRPVAEALGVEDPGVRTAATIAAGRLLGELPTAFPRTATALLDALDDEDDRVRAYAHVALANFAREHPSNVPQKARALTALAGVDDDELGLRRGTVGDALAALVAQEFRADDGTGRAGDGAC